MQLLGWGWKNTACRQILVRGRLQRAIGFSNAVILAAVRTECTRVIRCRKNLADRLARVDWLPEGKRRRRAAFCRLSELASRVSVDKVAATRLVERNRSYLCRICKTAARCFLWFLSNHSSLRTANTEKRVEGAFGACSGTDWCPHAVQVALATDRVGTPGKDGGAITSRNVIAAREAAATAAEGLSIRRGSCGTPPYQGEGAREPANGAPTRLTLRNADRYHSELDSE